MDAVTDQQPSGPRPFPLESISVSSEEKMSAQRQLQWQESYGGDNLLKFTGYFSQR